MDRVIPYSVGICAMSACADGSLSGEEVAAEANVLHPTGISSKWEISSDTHFRGGKSTNPCQCEDDPSRKHWLLNC